MIWFQFIYACFCIVFAYDNKRRIGKYKPIPHGVNGLVHFLIWTVFYLLFHSVFVSVLPFIARLIFDTALNLLRGKNMGYVPVKPRSIADKVEKFIWGDNALTPKVLYLWVIVICLIIQSNIL